MPMPNNLDGLTFLPVMNHSKNVLKHVFSMLPAHFLFDFQCLSSVSPYASQSGPTLPTICASSLFIGMQTFLPSSNTTSTRIRTLYIVSHSMGIHPFHHVCLHLRNLVHSLRSCGGMDRRFGLDIAGGASLYSLGTRWCRQDMVI